MTAGAEANAVFDLASRDALVPIRDHVQAAATEAGFSRLRATKALTIASELARNVLHHAGRGTVTVERLSGEAGAGLRMVFEDEGPGIDDVERALEDGTKREGSDGLGKGLAGSRRLADEFSIDSSAGRGTRVEVVVWAG